MWPSAFSGLGTGTRRDSGGWLHYLWSRRGMRRRGGSSRRSSSLGAEGETVQAAGAASSSDTEHFAGHSPLPSAPLILGDRGARPLPCSPRPHWHRGRHVVGITGAAGLGGRHVVGIAPLVLPAADMASASRGIASQGAVALAAGTPYRDRHRRFTGPPEHRPTPAPAVVCRVLTVFGPPRVISSGIGTSSVPATLTGCGL